MTSLRPALLVLAAATALAACASAPRVPGPGAAEPSLDAAAGSDDLVPAFCPDGRLRRDHHTEAPLFLAGARSVAARAPRFNDDGTVDRDPETGAPVYEEVLEGAVVRVLVALP